MVSTRRVIDEVGDYVLELGSPQEDASHVSQVLLALTTQKGSFLPDSTFGSRLHEIKTLGSNSDLKAIRFVHLALKGLVDRGAISNLRVAAEARDGRLPIDIDYTDSGGFPRQVRHTHEV